MPTIFIPIESTLRELDYKINLARLFCKEGLAVVIGNPPFLRDELKYKNYRAIFLEKGFNPDPEYYQYLIDKGVVVYDFSDEGAAKPVYSINYSPVIEILKKINAAFLWGEAQKHDLSVRNPEEEITSKYKVIGAPAFDLSTPKYKYFHEILKPKNLPESYILINTNFGCYQSYTIEEYLEACSKISPLSIQMIREAYTLEEKQFEIFKEWLENIIQFFPNETFLIRPHPVEIKENYKKIFSRYKNVIISKEGNANQIIASAKLVLHKDCSTAMQSCLMGVPTISVGGESLAREYAQWPLAFSMQPDTIDQAKELIQKILVDKKWDEETQASIDKKAKKILEANFHNIGEASKALVDFIKKDAEQLIKDKSPYKLIDSRSKIQKLKHFVRKLLPLHYKIDIATRETLIKFTKRDISKRLNAFESVDPLGIEFSIKKIFPNVYKISKK